MKPVMQFWQTLFPCELNCLDHKISNSQFLESKFCEKFTEVKKKKRETTLFFFNFHSQPVNTESNGIASDVNHNLSAYINACTQGNYLNSQDNC